MLWRKKRRPVLELALAEALEPRILYAADLAAGLMLGGAAATPDADAAEQRVLDAGGEYAPAAASAPPATEPASAATRREIVFVDAAVPDAGTLLADLAAARPGVALETVVIAGGDDGIARIDAALAGRQDLAALHLISHGAAGELRLGATTLDAGALARRGDEIAAWGRALGEDADILIYGCDVASGDGAAFVRTLAALTGADVAASTNPTGAASLGGDWNLEARTGIIDAAAAPDAAARFAWAGLLAPNTAPVLDATRSPVLVSQQEDAGAPVGAAGTLVSALVDFAVPAGEMDNVVDPDAGAQLGIAVTGADSANGSWWFSQDDGATWLAMGAVSDANALLLAADPGVRVAFQANPDFAGTLPAALTFRAWDRTSGSPGGSATVVLSSTVRDEFGTAAYTNNNGSANWSGAWVENDSNGGGATGGRILVAAGQLDIRANNAGNWIERAVNLAGMTAASLSFNFTNALGGADSIVVQASGDGGASYTPLAGATFSSTLNTGSGSRSYDISAHISADTRIRFLVSAIGAKNHLYIDNVQVASSVSYAGGSNAFSAASDSAGLVINALNDPPVITLPAPQTAVEDGTLVLSAAGGNAIGVGDVDAGSGALQVSLTATNGTLSMTPLAGSEFRANIGTTGDQQAPAVAVAADGHYVMAWQGKDIDKNGIFARVYNADGSPRSGEIAVNTLTTDDQTAPVVAIDAAGRFVVAWQNYNPALGGPAWDIYARSFSADGSPATAQVRLNTTTGNDQGAPAVAMDSAGNIVVAWQSRGQDNGDGKNGIVARRFAVDLTPASGEFLVNTTTVDDQTSPAIASAGASGDFVIAWESKAQDGSGLGVFAQRFSAAGVKAGGEFRVNAATASDQMAPKVAVNSAGDFIIAWQSKGQDNPPETGKFGIYAQRYNAAGSAQGGEILVNTTVSGEQVAPAVALADSGSFTVAWTSSGEDHADGKQGVYARSFNAAGAPIGAALRANTTTLDAQSAPAIGVDADGKLLVAWQSASQDGSGLGIYGQRFKTPGALTFSVGDGSADASMTFTGTIGNLRSYLDGLVFTPTPNYNGPAVIGVAIDDLGNSGAGGALAAGASLAINVAAVNDGPSQTLPGAQVTDEDVAVVFSAARGTAITIADIDADPLDMQVTLSAANGTLTLGSLAGLTVSAGANGSSLVVVRGSQAALNAGLDGTVYQTNANYFGADSVSVTTSDLGNTGTGGILTASGSIGITANSINDAPVNVLPASQSITEGSVLTLSTANGNAVRLSDVDAFLGIEELTLAATHGTLRLARTNGLTFSLGDGGGGETRMTFRGTLVNINAALDGLRFTPDAGYAGPAYLELIASDLGNSGAGVSLGDRDVLAINVLPDANNAAPIITVPGNQTTLEETPLVLGSATGNLIQVNDDAGGNPIEVTLSVTGGVLTLSTSSGPESLVNSTVLGDQAAARVAMNAAGDYVAVWQSNNQDGSGKGVYAQRFNRDGIALAPEFRVNTSTAGDQAAPVVVMSASGSFVVAWQSKDQDGDGFGIYAQRYNAAGLAQGGEFRVNSSTFKNQTAPALAIDAAGNFVAVWQSENQDGDGYGIYAQRYNAAGTAQGGEFRVNSTTFKEQTAPAVATDAAGNFVAVWQSENQDGDGYGIYAQRYNAAGTAQGGEFLVNTITYKAQTEPAIAMDDAGNFVVVWQSLDIDYNDGKGGIYAQRYNAAGAAAGGQFLVNTRTPNAQTIPAVAMDAGGGFVIAWQSMNQDHPDHGAGVYAQRYDPTGARVAGEFLVNTTTADHQTAPAVGLSDGGRFVVLWTADKQDGSGTGVYAQRYFDTRFLAFSAGDGIDDASMTFRGTLDQVNDALDGLVFTPAANFDGNARLDIIVNDLGNSGAGGPRSSNDRFNIGVQAINDAPTIQVPAPQTFIEGSAVVFSAAGANPIVIADVDAGNNKLAVTLTATAGALTLAGIGGLTFSAGDGNADASMSFTAKPADIASALEGLRLDLPAGFSGSTAVQVGVNDQGNTGSGGALAATATAFVDIVPDPVNSAPRVALPAPQYTPQDTPLALLATLGRQVSVIDDAGSNPVTLTLTATNGTLTLSNTVGPEVRANTYTLSDQDGARIAMQPDGSFVAVWRSSGQDLSGGGVYAQRFNPAGLAVGAEFRVNTTTAGNQWAPAVAVSRNGAFVVAWVSDGQDGSGRGVYAQRYSAAGIALGGEVLVNTAIAGDQFSPTAAIADDGAFVIAWASDDGDGKGIFAQRFDANGNQQGGEFLVNAAAADNQVAPDAAMDAAGNFVIAWQGEDASGDGVFARRFAADGTPQGGDFLVNSTTAGAQEVPVVAMNAGGAFVIAWQGPEAGGGTGIFAQRYDAAGTPQGGEMPVNTTVAGNQVAPDVAINDAGEFVVAWQGPDANNQGAFAQVFHADGSRLGREVGLNTTTQGNQLAPSVGMAADGTFAAAWAADNLDPNGSAVAVQRMQKGDELTYNIGTGVGDAVVSVTGTLASVNAALDGMRFSPSAGYNGPASIRVEVDDLGNSGSGGALTGQASLDIAVGKAPIMDLDADDSSGAQGSGYLALFTPGLGAVRIADLDATLVDATSGNLASLTVRITNLMNPGSEVLAANTGGTTIIATYTAATGTLSLTGSNSVANYQKVLRTITYNNTAGAPDPALRQISFVAYDGGFQSNTATTLLRYAGANLAPVAAANSYSVAEDGTLAVPAAGVLSNDSDANGDTLTASLTAGPSNGILSLNANGSFTYTPASNFNGADSFSYRAFDGMAYSASATVTLTVTAVNDAPAGTGTTISAEEDIGKKIKRQDFGFSDAADSPINGFAGVLVTSLPAAGTLTFDGAAVSIGQVLDISRINAERLIFTPAAGASGAAYASFGFRVIDDGGTAGGGVDTDPITRTLTINVTPVNDAPTGTDKTASAAEDTPFVFATGDFGFADPGDAPANALAAVTIASLPAAGTLALNGVAVTAGQSISAADVAAGRLTFTAGANASGNGYASFIFQVQDDGGIANGGVDLDPTPRSMTIDVGAVNDPPTLALPAAQSIASDNPLVFSGAGGNPITVADIDAGGGSLKVSLAVANGVLTLSGTGGLSFSAGSGSGDASMTFSGDLGAINAALDGLRFDPTTGYAGSTALNILVDDSGNTGAGGLASDTGTIVINVSTTNNAPDLAGANNLASKREDLLADAGTKVATLIAGQVSDADPGALGGIAVTAVDNTHGQWQYTVDGGAGWLSLAGVTPGAARLLAADPSFAVRFQPDADWNGTVGAGISFHAWDRTSGAAGDTADTTVNGGTSAFSNAIASAGITITPVNDAPAGTGATIAIPEDTPRTLGVADFGFADTRDTPTNAIAGVRIASLPAAGSLTANGVTVTSGQLISVADIVAGRLVFSPAANAAGAGHASFTFQVQDDGGTADGGADTDPVARTLTIDVTAVNDAPAGADRTVTALEDTPHVFGLSEFALTDSADTPANVLAAVTIVALPGAGTLALNGVGVSAGQVVAAADIAAGRLSFSAAANTHGAGYATFTFRVQDDGGIAGGGADTDPVARSMTIDVTPVNDAPAGADGTVSALEDTAYAFRIADFGFSDAADAPANALAAVTVATLPAAGTLALDGLAVTAGQAVSAADIAAGRLTFIAGANAHGAGYAAFTFHVQDDGGIAGGGADTDPIARSMTIDVASVNDAPTGANNGVTILEDGAYTFNVADFGFADADDTPANALLAVRIAATTGAGVLTNNGIAVTAGDAVSVADIAAGRLVFSPAANANGGGYASFTFQVQDDDGIADGGADTDPLARTFAIGVTPVNDAPAGTSTTVTTTEDMPYTFGLADFGFGDGDDTPANAFLALAIGALPGAGTLALNAVAVTAGQTIAGADIAAGKLTFTAAANAHGSAYASFTFRVQDDGGIANGGADLDLLARTVTIDVTPVNDAPAGADRTLTTFEDTPYTLAVADFGFVDGADTPANTFTALTVVTLPGAGALTANGIAVTAGQLISVADIVAGRLVFSPAANAAGAGHASFTFQVQDDGGTADGGADTDPVARTLTIDVTAVNDAPAGADRTVTALEDTPHVFGLSEFALTDSADTPANVLAAVTIVALPGAGTLALNGVGVSAGQVVAAADIAAGRLSFSAAANTHGAGYATFTFRVQDDGGIAGGGADTDPVARSMTIDVMPANDAPSGTDGVATVLENTPYTFVAADFGFADTGDTPADNLLEVRINSLPGAGSLANNGAAVTAGQWISAADIAAGRLVFTPLPNTKGAGYASFAFQLRDDGGLANGGIDLDPVAHAMTLDVISPNVAPSGASNTVNTPEDIVYTFGIADFGFADAGDSPAHALRAVRIATAPGAGTLANNGIAVGAGDFVSAADIAAGKLRFTPVADASGAAFASFTFQVQDDGGTAYSGADLDPVARSMTIDVTAVNDAPAGADRTVAVGENTTYAFGVADFGFSDPRDAPPHALAAVRIDSVPASGTLALSGVAVAPGQSVAATDIAAARLTFRPAGLGTAAFGFRVQDNGGGADIDPAIRTMLLSTSAPAAAALPADGTPPDAPAAPTPPAGAPAGASAATTSAAAGTSPAATTTAAAAGGGSPGNAADSDGGSSEPGLLLTSGRGAAAADAARSLRADAGAPLPQSGERRAFAFETVTLIDGIISSGGRSEGSRAMFEQFMTSLRAQGFLDQLDRLRDGAQQEFDLEKSFAVTATGVTFGLSIAYVLWLVRSGVLMGSLLSSLPAWRVLDPLPVLAREGDDDDDDDDLPDAPRRDDGEALAALRGY